MQTIITRHIGATSTKPDRIVARTSSGIRIIRSVWANKQDRTGDTHAAVALELAQSIGWKGTLVRGDTQDGCVFVFDNEQDKYRILDGYNSRVGYLLEKED